MNPLEVVQRARTHFGEQTAMTLQDITVREWVNDAMKELYGYLYWALPSHELITFVNTDTQAVAAGTFTVPDTWDQILSVSEDGVPLLEVAAHSIRAIDSHMMFQPVQSVWARRDNTVWVRPDTIGSVEVSRLEPPAPFDTADTTGDFEEGTPDIQVINPRWHQALVWFVTSYAYAQEEDLQQAEHYRGRAMAMIPQPTEEG